MTDTNVVLFPGAPDDDGHQDQTEIPTGEVIAPEVVKGKGGERRAIIPVPLQRAQLKSTVTYHSGLNWHRARYHGLRLPFLYLPLAVWWGSIGALKLALTITAWAHDVETEFLAREAVGQGDSAKYLQLSRHARDARRVRLTVVGIGATVLVIALVLLAVVAPMYIGALVALVTVPVLARLGRPDDKPIITQAIVPPTYTAPTHPLIEQALGSIGIAQINSALKDNGHIAWITDVFRDGAGWAVEFDAPFGCTAEMILAKRDMLASGLRRPLSAVWPEPRPIEHPGRVNLWIGFTDASKVPPPSYPLIKSGTTDIFRSETLPFGTSPRQQPVTNGLFELNHLYGGAPGQGKSNAVRVSAANGILDSVCDVFCHEFSGKGDLEPASRISHRYVAGLDDESIAYGAQSLKLLRAELEKRSTLFKQIPRDQRPAGSLTREIALKHKELRPIVAIFDECQNMFMHPKYGKEAADDAAYIIRLGRAYGLIIVLSTQRPDKDSLPTAISGIVTSRFCLSVPDQVSNDMILGTSSYSNGYNSTLFRPKTDRGWGWLKGESSAQTVRTYKLDLPEFDRVCIRARALREQAGCLSGYALGQDDDSPARDVLRDVHAVFSAGAESGLQWAELAARLGDRYPDRYADITASSISGQLRDLGVPGTQVKSGGTNRQGCKLADVERLVTA